MLGEKCFFCLQTLSFSFYFFLETVLLVCVGSPGSKLMKLMWATLSLVESPQPQLKQLAQGMPELSELDCFCKSIYKWKG